MSIHLVSHPLILFSLYWVFARSYASMSVYVCPIQTHIRSQKNLQKSKSLPHASSSLIRTFRYSKVDRRIIF